ncbi:MAG: ParB/RepB/Spo0J family partition protein [Lachnospiraceae bacterium]|nr:ParB/RepB/Spo0J family partition protein [Lachnospiraceae bacterium]
MMNNKTLPERAQLKRLDSLFGIEDDKDTSVMEIALEELYTFHNHPFKVVDDDKMDELVESIKEKGVLTPILVRKREEDGYEIISGHRRKRASELAGLGTIPAIIKEVNDDDAVILMVDSNIQREHILPSERAFSMQMKMNAWKHQGRRTDLEEDEDNSYKTIADKVGEAEGISGRMVRKYVRLTELIPELLKCVDEEVITIDQANELSFIQKENQKKILPVISDKTHKLTDSKAKKLREASNDQFFDEYTVDDILIGKIPEKTNVTFTKSELKSYFPDTWNTADKKEKIIELLNKWKEESSYE